MKDDLPGTLTGSPDIMYGPAARPALKVDFDRYQRLIDDPRLSDAQKRQVVEALWTIIVAFVDMGFGISPVQQACGQLGEPLAGGSERTGDCAKLAADTPKIEP